MIDVEALVRRESGRVLATLVRLLGDLDRAEEVLHDALLSALERWPYAGVPENPGAWLMTTARNRALDILRAERRQGALREGLAPGDEAGEVHTGELADDRLRLIFTCCHPALSPEARVALTLRMVGGLETPDIARAFLVPEPTVAQRIVRAKRVLRERRIPYRVPEGDELAERLPSVLQVVYLVFNEGYTAGRGAALTRVDLCEEALRLAELLAADLPEPETLGLCALLLLHTARLGTRVDGNGEMVLLEDQDRTRWDRARIDRGIALLERAAARPGPYVLQAAIAACHAQAESFAGTDWRALARLYEALHAQTGSPVVELNRAVAVSHAEGPAAGLAVLDGIGEPPELRGYHLLHATRADMLRRLGRTGEAAAAYRRALELAENEPERRFISRRLLELGVTPGAASS